MLCFATFILYVDFLLLVSPLIFFTSSCRYFSGFPLSIACTRHGVDKRSEIQRKALGYLREEYLEFQCHDAGCHNALIRPREEYLEFQRHGAGCHNALIPPRERVCKDTPHRSTVELDRRKEEFVASHVLALPSSLPVANKCSRS